MNWGGIGNTLLAALVMMMGLSLVFFWSRMLVFSAMDRRWGWFVFILSFSLLGAVIYWMWEQRGKKAREAREDREFLLDFREELTRRDPSEQSAKHAK